MAIQTCIYLSVIVSEILIKIKWHIGNPFKKIEVILISHNKHDARLSFWR